MASQIDYYLSPVSPWAYLGAPRFIEMVQRHGVAVRVMPIDLGQVFPVSGGLPLAKRPAQRRAYRLVELARWRDFLGLPLNIQPRFTPVDDKPAARLIVAAREGGEDALGLSYALGRAVWAEERNIADPETLEEIVVECGLDPARLFAAAETEPVAAAMQADTERAIANQVFGVPTYILDGEPFWGQDRLDFLHRALQRKATAATPA